MTRSGLLPLVYLALTVPVSFPCAQAIGMRHDVDETLFISLANNQSPFEPGRVPNFGAVAAVGLLDRRNQFEVIGSGVLVSPQWILTAAHVVLASKGGQNFEPGIEVRFGARAAEAAHRRNVIDIATPIPVPQLRPLQGRGLRFSERQVVHAEFHDLALLKLDRPVDHVPPASLDEEDEKLLGRMVYIAGFGDGAKGNNSRARSWTAADLKRAAANMIDREINRNPLNGRNSGGVLLFDFDNGEEERNTLNARSRVWDRLFGSGKSSPVPTQLEGASYPGDSGGPAFARVNGKWCVVGISGYGTGYPPDRRRTSIQYGDILVYTRVSQHAGWIRRTTRSRSSDPVIATGPPEGSLFPGVEAPPPALAPDSGSSAVVSEVEPLSPRQSPPLKARVFSIFGAERKPKPTSEPEPIPAPKPPPEDPSPGNALPGTGSDSESEAPPVEPASVFR